MATTAGALIQTAMGLIGAYSPSEPMDASDAQLGLTLLNGMMSQWQLQTGTVPYRQRSVFTVNGIKGGPVDPLVPGSGPYTMGPGGDWQDAQSTRPLQLEGAAVLLTQSQPNPVEVPLAVMTDDSYNAIQIKELTNGQSTCIYYQPTSPTANIYLWPIPNVTYNQIVLYYLALLGTFTSLSAAYTTPPGYDEAIYTNLAKRLAPVMGRTCPPEVTAWAATALAIMKRPNYRYQDMPQDIPTGNRQYGFNIQTGNM